MLEHYKRHQPSTSSSFFTCSSSMCAQQLKIGRLAAFTETQMSQRQSFDLPSASFDFTFNLLHQHPPRIAPQLTLVHTTRQLPHHSPRQPILPMCLQHKRCRRSSRQSAETLTSISPSQGLLPLTTCPHSTSTRRLEVLAMQQRPDADQSAPLRSIKINVPSSTSSTPPYTRPPFLWLAARSTGKQDRSPAAQLSIASLKEPTHPLSRPFFDFSNLSAVLPPQSAHDTGWILRERPPSETRAMRNNTVNNKPTALFVNESTLGTSTSAANCDDGELKYPRLVLKARGTSFFQEHSRHLAGVSGASHRLHLQRRSVGGSEHADYLCPRPDHRSGSHWRSAVDEARKEQSQRAHHLPSQGRTELLPHPTWLVRCSSYQTHRLHLHGWPVGIRG